MTYREKLQKEHPERVRDCWIGGCDGCPSSYGYTEKGTGPCRTQCKGVNNETCTECWDRVIPGTEKDKYKNLTRDELIEIINHLEHTIELEDKEIQHRGKLLNERDQKITNLEGACSTKNAEIVRLEKELEEEKLRKYFWCEDNCCAMVKDKEIAKLKDALEFKKAVISVANDTITELNDKLEKSEERVKSIKTRMEALGSANNRLRDDIRYRDSRIEYLESSVQTNRELLCISNDCVNRLREELAEEKKEHAKHHGLLAKYFAD